MIVLYSEENSNWEPLPDWVDWLIEFGRLWPQQLIGERRIGVLSLPFESPAAGLVTLGVLIRNLGIESASDTAGHHDALMQYAHQYVHHCSSCKLICVPNKTGCGFISEASGLLRHATTRMLWRVSRSTDFVHKQLVLSHPGGGSWATASSKSMLNLRIEGDPVLHASDEYGELPNEAYSQICPDAKILPRNLKESHTGLCFAGKVSGESATRSCCDSVKFRIDQTEYALSELLTIQGWSKQKLSRANYLNPRTAQFFRQPSSTSLLVADGDDTWERVSNQKALQRADVIVTFHRSVNRDRLESLAYRIQGLRQWYEPDIDFLDRFPQLPRGIALTVLRKRFG